MAFGRPSSLLAVALPCVYIITVAIFCLWYQINPGPEFLVLCFFIYAAYNKWSKKFVKDWIPFLTLFVSYQAMYGLVGAVSGIVHVSEPITAELQLFGSIPTVMLQQLYRAPILDYMGAFFYSLHFFAPTIFAFFMWKRSPRDYWKYTVALAVLTYSSLITFWFIWWHLLGLAPLVLPEFFLMWTKTWVRLYTTRYTI